jgi:hypothetical protein
MKITTIKVTTIALATALTLTSTFALAQTTGTEGYGSVVAPSVGSYQTSVGSTNVVPTWRNTGPAAVVRSSSARRTATRQARMGATLSR